ncbi:MAG: hypothetical protein HOV83_36250 [Catenulispora sp.]|nr:hypothetical protein [Catenulispora sp.]
MPPATAAPPSAVSITISGIASADTAPSAAKAHVTLTNAFTDRDRNRNRDRSTTGTAPALGSPTAAGATVSTQVPTPVRSPMP